jgi:glucokinase
VSGAGPGDEVVALDLGGTHLRAARVHADGTLGRRVRARTEHTERPDQLVEILSDLAADGDVRGAVLGLPGRVDRRSGELQHARNLPPTWTGFLNRAWLEQRTGLAVQLAGDVELAAVGEAWFGAGTVDGDSVHLSFSTGVGAAATTGGRLLAGRRAGFQIGFLRPPGAPGPLLDTRASGHALAAYAEVAGLGSVSVQELIGRADDGDRLALRHWADLVEHACWTAELMCHICVPDVITVGGGLTAAGDRLLGPVADAVRTNGVPGKVGGIDVRAGSLGDDAALVGAAVWHLAVPPAPVGRTRAARA